MYYNIKIKADDSEFSLESENKGIIENEMDAYFAYFFDASFEFKSKIKKVELTNDSLVSIDEFKAPEAHNEKEDEQEEEIQYYESSDDFYEEESEQVEEIKEEPQEVEQVEELEQIEEIEQIEEVEEQETSEEAIDDLLDDFVEEPQVIEEVSFKNEPFVPDIIMDEEEPEAEETIIIENEEENTIEEVPLVEEQKQTEPLNEKPSSKLDFKLFLAGFIISDIFNQFIACAYYIKNVLKENCFNMKTINSYLIKATGNIADMSIVFELMQKEYIDSKEINDSTVYYITALGEEYFIKKYQE